MVEESVAYIKSDIKSKRLLNLEDEEREVLWLKLFPKRIPRCFVVAGVYYPPGKSITEGKDMTNYLTQSLDTALRENPSAGILLAGDFNQLDLNSLCRRFNLKTLVHGPTRGNNTLDQILTNMTSTYNVAVHLPPLGKSDHQCLLVKPKKQVKVKPILRNVRIMRPRNITGLTIRMNEQNWNQVLDARDVDQKVY